MPKATRQSFGEVLARVGETNKDLVVLDADLAKSTMTLEFQKKFPDRHFEMGIAAQNNVTINTDVRYKIDFNSVTSPPPVKLDFCRRGQRRVTRNRIVIRFSGDGRREAPGRTSPGFPRVGRTVAGHNQSSQR